MKPDFRDKFTSRWEKYFPGAELPITFFYSDGPHGVEVAAGPEEGVHRCFICDLGKVRHGRSLCFTVDSLGCGGAKRYLGFSHELSENFEYFLSCGLEGVVEGERYKKTSELVREQVVNHPTLTAPSDYAVFKRWDKLTDDDQPAVVIFFAPADVLAGLFTLSVFDESRRLSVIAPFGAGCAMILDFPYRELESEQPHAVLGMFDISARHCVPADMLTFAVPWPKFVRMVNNIDESFLITSTWAGMKKRIARRFAG
jgi:hypothetical protein